jgi:hypothetical protein
MYWKKDKDKKKLQEQALEPAANCKNWKKGLAVRMEGTKCL